MMQPAHYKTECTSFCSFRFTLLHLWLKWQVTIEPEHIIITTETHQPLIVQSQSEYSIPSVSNKLKKQENLIRLVSFIRRF